jgi:hypothetical protein
MKKLFVGCSTVILILGVIMFIIFYAYKTYIVKDLNARNNQVESIWVSFIYKENLKNKKILNLLDSFEFENSDSLRLHISKNLNINDTLKCNEEFVYQEYLMKMILIIGKNTRPINFKKLNQKTIKF